MNTYQVYSYLGMQKLIDQPVVVVVVMVVVVYGHAKANWRYSVLGIQNPISGIHHLACKTKLVEFSIGHAITIWWYSV